MDLKRVKQIFCEQGEVQKILSGDVVLWEKPSVGRVIIIPQSTPEPITDFVFAKYAELTFIAEYQGVQGVPEWSISGLPAGLSAEVVGESLKISGYASEVCSKNVTIKVTIGNFSDTQIYTFIVYGINITTSNAAWIYDFEAGKNTSKTFEASIYVPEEEQASPVEWSFSGLPSGISVSGATISGEAVSTGVHNVTVTLTKGSYSASKTFKFMVYGLAITTESLPNGERGKTYSAALAAKTNLSSSNSNPLMYYEDANPSNLPAGLKLNNSTGVISGIPTTLGTSSFRVLATQSPYVSTEKSLSITIVSPPMGFAQSEITVLLSINSCKASKLVGECIERRYIYGSGFAQAGVIFHILSNNTVVLSGNSTATSPVIYIPVTIIDDNTLTLDFILQKKAPASPKPSLSSRGYTQTKLYMYTMRAGFKDNGPSSVGAQIISSCSISIGFH